MHFITFAVATTNIFPLSNSTKGGQLVTEFNLKSRDMVATNPDIKYQVGPSFIHSLDDFKVKLLEDTDVPDYDATKTYNKGDYCIYDNDTYICVVDITTPEPFDSEHWNKTVISTSIIQVDPGRAVINGHYVETLAPMIVDLKAANAELQQTSQEPLYGNLSIGIKSYFSTENTMSGAMLVENTDNMYVGIQLVITKTSDFKTPDDCPTDRDSVTADIKLADFTYVNGAVSESSITPNVDATRYIPSSRIRDFDSILDDKYVTAENLVDRLFYTYSGKSGWCDSTGSLMVFDQYPEQHQVTEDNFHTAGEAKFVTDSDGNVHFVIPHKQQDAIILNDNDERLFYADKDLQFPTADFATGSSGIVNEKYTQNIKDIAAVINTYKQFTNGKQIMYLDTLSVDSEGKLSYDFPTDLSKFNVGDYILVREDYTVSNAIDDGVAPSTMYFVLPGGVIAVDPMGLTTTQPDGVRLGNTQSFWEGDGTPVPTTEDPDASELLDLFNYTTYRGTTDDYFEIIYHNIDDTVKTSYYYPVSSAGAKTWSNPILLTGGVPLATEDQIGGFYNASTDAEYADAGYVYLDNTGHLRLLDYALLRYGTLAYQLGEDFRVPSNQTLEYVQSYLDESVNARIAFRTNAQLTTTPTMLNVYIPLPEEEGVINLYNIDSRFGTGVYVHFLTENKNGDYSGITINITDCEKIRIDNSITTLPNGPIINVFRSCLYYDAEIINYIRVCDPDNKREEMFPAYTDFTGFEDLTLWYSRFATNDPDLIVNGMEISQPNVAMATQEITFWDESVSGDNHYSYALRSITLSGSGKLISCSLYVSNNSTPDTSVDANSHIIIGGKFVLPQGSALNYPLACINSPLQITGTFTTAYLDSFGTKWITTETSFTAKTGVYSVTTGMADGSIAFNSKTELLDTTYTNVQTIDGWAPGSYHIFYGGTTV